MKTLLSRLRGGPDTLVLEEVPSPQPAPGSVIVSVRTCGINYFDSLIIEDKYQLKPPRPFAPGSEIAGVVARVGAGVTRFKPGDRVAAILPFGGLAEEVAVDSQRLVAIPASMPFDDAAGLLMNYGTAYYALHNRGRLRAGDRLLILGAGGGIGLAAVELGKSHGAYVIAAASSEEKTSLAREHGAQATVTYPTAVANKEEARALTDALKKACGPNGADVVYDGVGGSYAEAALRSIAWDGRFLVIGFPAGIPQMPLNLVLLKSAQVIGVSYGAAQTRDPAMGDAINQSLLELYVAGKIRPLISERFALAQGGAAIRRLARRESHGKVVVTVAAATH